MYIEVIKEPVFSKKITDVFYKIYGVPKSVRYLPMSWATHFHKIKPFFNVFEPTGLPTGFRGFLGLPGPRLIT